MLKKAGFSKIYIIYYEYPFNKFKLLKLFLKTPFKKFILSKIEFFAVK